MNTVQNKDYIPSLFNFEDNENAITKDEPAEESLTTQQAPSQLPSLLLPRSVMEDEILRISGGAFDCIKTMSEFQLQFFLEVLKYYSKFLTKDIAEIDSDPKNMQFIIDCNRFGGINNKPWITEQLRDLRSKEMKYRYSVPSKNGKMLRFSLYGNILETVEEQQGSPLITCHLSRRTLYNIRYIGLDEHNKQIESIDISPKAISRLRGKYQKRLYVLLMTDFMKQGQIDKRKVAIVYTMKNMYSFLDVNKTLRNPSRIEERIFTKFCIDSLESQGICWEYDFHDDDMNIIDTAKTTTGKTRITKVSFKINWERSKSADKLALIYKWFKEYSTLEALGQEATEVLFDKKNIDKLIEDGNRLIEKLNDKANKTVYDDNIAKCFNKTVYTMMRAK